MFGIQYLTYFISFLALLSSSLAVEYYRQDYRAPAQVKRDGGLVSRNPTGDGSILDHVRNTLGTSDPWESTTKSYAYAESKLISMDISYIYYIDPSGLNAVDAAQAFANAGQKYPYPNEQEVSIKGSIPWDHITKWDTYDASVKVGTTTRQDFDNGVATKKRMERPLLAWN